MRASLVTVKQRVAIEFSDDLAESIARAGAGREVIVIGDRSAVAHGAHQAGLKCQPVAALTGLDGETTLAAAFVARSSDSAKSLKEITGRKILFGLTEADGKGAAAVAALRAAAWSCQPSWSGAQSTPTPRSTCWTVTRTRCPWPWCPLTRSASWRAAAAPRPALKVIATTQPVPFITVFMADAIAAKKREMILSALFGIKGDAKLLKALESRDGFKTLNSGPQSNAGDWPDWRGPARDGHVPRLPERLPSQPKLVWKKAAMTGGLAGLSVSGGRLILALDGGAARHALEHAHLADDAAGAHGVDLDAALQDSHLAEADEVDGVGGIALADERLAVCEPLDLA